MCPRHGRRLPTPRCAFYRSFGQRHIAHVTISRLESSRGRSREAAGAQKKKNGRIPSSPFVAPLNAQVAEFRTVCKHSALAYQGEDLGAVRDCRLAEFSMKRESLRPFAVGDRRMPGRYQDRPRTSRLE
jgi:hypothetical protein